MKSVGLQRTHFMSRIELMMNILQTKHKHLINAERKQSFFDLNPSSYPPTDLKKIGTEKKTEEIWKEGAFHVILRKKNALNR